jgi:ArsR family transcriptional regulator
MKSYASYELHAAFCKTLANPKRLQILDLLHDGEWTVGALAKQMGIRDANVSQHLALLRSVGAVKTRRDGVEVYYELADPILGFAYEVMTQALQKLHGERTRLIEETSEGDPI